jgi:hypothetical protein
MNVIGECSTSVPPLSHGCTILMLTSTCQWWITLLTKGRELFQDLEARRSLRMATLIDAEVQRILAEWQQQQTTLRIMRESSLHRYGYEQRRKKYRFQG